MLGFEELVILGDRIGVVAFAFAGVLIGVNKKLDIFGLLLVGIFSAVGGGIFRDIILARIPFAIRNFDYFGLAFGASFLTILLVFWKVRISSRLVIFADSIGLGAFAATGSIVALNAELSIFHTVFFAVLTAVGGGMFRDVLINTIPFILKKELYGSVAGVGGFITHIVYFAGLSMPQAAAFGMATTVILRLYAVKKNLNLPVLH